MIPKLIILLIAITLSAGFYSCSKGESEEKKQTEDKKLPLVKIQSVESSTFTDNFKVVGEIKPFAEAKISSEQGGLISSLTKDKGSPVGKGEIVAKIKKIAFYGKQIPSSTVRRANASALARSTNLSSNKSQI
jgi:multidrug efflux pump subunit AcrA (membrane-fusion protein)